MRSVVAASSFGLIWLLGGPALACSAAGAEPVTVSRVTPAGELALIDGRLLTIAGVEPWRSPKDAGVLHDEPARWIAELIADGDVRALIAAEPADRWGRQRAEIFLGGQHLQTALAQAGAAMLRSGGVVASCAAAVRAAEAPARAAGLRLWAGPDAPVAQAQDGAKLSVQDGRFIVVTGQPTRFSMARNRAFLDFGLPGSGALTVTIRKEALTRLGAAGFKPQEWLDRPVTVRGTLERRRNPTIEIEGPEGIELIGRR